MDILSLVEDAKKQHLSFEKHPAKDLDMEQKTHYLNGLALLMNVDEEIHEKEKEYMIILLRTFDLPDEKLEEFIQFARNPDKKAILELIASFTERDIKYVFLFDCLMLAHRDDKFVPTEKKLIEDYFEMFKLTVREKEQIFYLHDKIIKQDKKALYRLFLQKDSLKRELYTYLLDYYELNVENITEEYMKDIKEEIGKIEFLNVKNIHYDSIDEISLSKLPISNKLYSYFLQFLLDKNEAKIDNKKIVTADAMVLIDLTKANIALNNNNIEVEKEGFIVDVTISGIKRFFKWINDISSIKFQLPHFTQDSSLRSYYDYISFKDVEWLQFFKELIHLSPSYDYWYVMKKKELSGTMYYDMINPEDNKILDGITFRLQKVEKNENKD